MYILLCIAYILQQYVNYDLHVLQLNDAYEEVDEQRQVVAQWKRKTHETTERKGTNRE